MNFLFLVNVIWKKVATQFLKSKYDHICMYTFIFQYFELKYKGREVRLLGTTIGMLGYVCIKNK